MIARKTWRELRWMTVAYTFLLIGPLIPAVLLYPELRARADAISEALPMKWMRDMAAALAADDPDFAYRQYMAVQTFFKGINIAGIAAAVLFCTALIARERENRTLEFLLSRPVSRNRILRAKFGVAAACLVVPIFLSTWSTMWMSSWIDQSLPFWELTVAAFHSSVFVLLFAAATLLCSVVARSQAQTAFIAGGVIVVQAVLYFIQEINVTSVFNLSDFLLYGPILEGRYPLWGLFRTYTGWILLATVGLLAVAEFQFRRAKL